MSFHAELILADILENSALPSAYHTQSGDVRHFIYDQLGIPEVRQWRTMVATSSFGAGPHVFVILARRLTAEAQNAMLKLFEEPPTHTIFYLIIPSETLLLPTLRSRFVQVAHTTTATTQSATATEFLRASYAKRLELIADYHKKKDTAAMESLAREICVYATTTKNQTIMSAATLVDSYVGIRGANRKMLLEELALSIPISSV